MFSPQWYYASWKGGYCSGLTPDQCINKADSEWIKVAGSSVILVPSLNFDGLSAAEVTALATYAARWKSPVLWWHYGVMTNAYAAEFGRGGASVSNLTFRSGSNIFHGAAWEQYKGASLNALSAEDRLGDLKSPAQFVGQDDVMRAKPWEPEAVGRIEVFINADEARLLHAMGCETANIHLGSHDSIKKIRSHIERRPMRWLHDAAKLMAKAITKDWKVFTA